jgi:hypothetical protein
MIEEKFLQNPNYIVQSIIIHKSKATLDQAIKWLIKHNFNHQKIDEKLHTWRFRQIAPVIARKRGFTNFKSHKLGNSGITLVLAYHSSYSGGDLSPNELADLLKKSYDPNVDDVGDWDVDREISNKASQVYNNKKTGENVIVHRGTQDKADILNDIKYAFGYDPEFPIRKATQEKAKAKYGNNLTTIGHSLGSISAERLAEPNSKVITLDKPVNFTDWINSFYKSSNPNQIDIRHKYDPVSFLSPMQKREGKLITIDEPDAKWYDIFENHKTSKLRKLVGLY